MNERNRVKIKEVIDKGCEVILEDGTTLSLRTVVVDVFREDKQDNDEKPVFNVKHTTLINVM